MSEPTKKRKFWQLHLSTAVVLMFVAGFFIFANTIAKTSEERESYEHVFAQDSFNVFSANYIREKHHASYGFPIPAIVITEVAERTDILAPNVVSVNWHVTAIAIDIIALMTTITCVAASLEFIFRRREGREP